MVFIPFWEEYFILPLTYYLCRILAATCSAFFTFMLRLYNVATRAIKLDWKFCGCQDFVCVGISLPIRLHHFFLSLGHGRLDVRILLFSDVPAIDMLVEVVYTLHMFAVCAAVLMVSA